MLIPTRITTPAQFSTCCSHRHAHDLKFESQNTTNEKSRLDSLRKLDLLQCPRQDKPHGDLGGAGDTEIPRLCVMGRCQLMGRCEMRCRVSNQSKTLLSYEYDQTCHIEMPKLCAIEDSKTDSQVPKQRKKVRFHHSAKKHDGLAPQQANLQRLVLQFFQTTPNLEILVQMVHNRKHEQLRMLMIHVRRVIFRVSRSPSAKTPLLEKGGGKSIMFRKANLPQLVKLLAATKKAYQMCAALISENKRQRSPS